MSRERLRALREQAERLDPEIKTAALLRIARVEAAFDRAKALRTFDAALDTLGKIEGTNRQFLNGRARMIAAAIAPERLDTIPSEQRVAIRVMDNEQLVRTMVDHGHWDAAVSYTLRPGQTSEFPFGMVSALLHSSADRETSTALLRSAVNAWRDTAASDRPHRTHRFIEVFGVYWTLLPPSEAVAVIHELVEETQGYADDRTSVRFGDDVTFTSAAQSTLFQILHVLRALDPELADTLTLQHYELATAARRFPNGMDSLREQMLVQMEQARARQEEEEMERPRPPRRNFGMAGSMTDFAYMQSLMEAEQDGNFDPPLEHAVERYREDTSRSNPNQAPKEFWRSTNAFRSILYRAGMQFGRSAAMYLESIPDEELRLLAAVELEAAVEDLPEFHGSIIERRPAPRLSRPNSVVSSPSGVETPAEEILDNGVCGPQIRCPKCKWQPRKNDRWACTCGHMWNTFDTGGVCPGCMHQWKDTQCPQCHQWSPHSEWYAQD